MPRILFLEDELLIRTGAVDYLTKAGFDVVGAESLAEARRYLSNPNADFDLLALNVQLEDGDGCDLCEELRKGGCDLPILMHSGHSSNRVLVRAMRAGATDYLVKSYLPSELIARIQFLLDLPPVAHFRVHRNAGRGSNLPTPQSYINPLLTSALAHLESVRPLPGTLPEPEIGQGEDEGRDVRTVLLHEAGAARLQQTLEEIRDLLRQESPDPDRVADLRAALINALMSISNWLGGRATVVTDEALKRFTTIGIAAYAAHVMGLRLDLMHILTALAALGGVGH